MEIKWQKQRTLVMLNTSTYEFKKHTKQSIVALKCKIHMHITCNIIKIHIHAKQFKLCMQKYSKLHTKKTHSK